MMNDRTVVIDCGSGTCKAGFCSDDLPKAVFPSIVGRPKYGRDDMDPKIRYVGEEAKSRRSILDLHYPVQRGVVSNWDDMEKIWNHVFENELKVFPELQPILLSEVPLNNVLNREMSVQIMFETFNAPSMYIAVDAVLSTYSCNRSTALILDSGYGKSTIVPVVDGLPMHHNIIKLNVAGHDLTNYLLRLLNERGYSFTTPAEREIVRDIKEKLCYVALDFKKEMSTAASSSSVQKSYKLPDGEDIIIGSERFRVPEALFEPSFVNAMTCGVNEAITKTIMRCENHERLDLYDNIILCGGNSMYPGLPDRLKLEISRDAPSNMQVQIIAPPERKYTVWNGGSILASLPVFKGLCLTKEVYNESGPRAIYRTTW